jgi:hypothetical protein
MLMKSSSQIQTVEKWVPHPGSAEMIFKVTLKAIFLPSPFIGLQMISYPLLPVN